MVIHSHQQQRRGNYKPCIRKGDITGLSMVAGVGLYLDEDIVKTFVMVSKRLARCWRKDGSAI